MSYYTDLTTAKANLTGLIASVTASPKPSYSLNGQSVSWEQYLSTLMRQVQAINMLIQVEDNGGRPQWIMTQGVT